MIGWASGPVVGKAGGEISAPDGWPGPHSGRRLRARPVPMRPLPIASAPARDCRKGPSPSRGRERPRCPSRRDRVTPQTLGDAQALIRSSRHRRSVGLLRCYRVRVQPESGDCRWATLPLPTPPGTCGADRRGGQRVPGDHKPAGSLLPRGHGRRQMKQAAMHLLMRRARLIGAAAKKLTALDQVIGTLPVLPKTGLWGRPEYWPPMINSSWTAQMPC